MSDIYSTLNPQQQEAVYHTEGPLLILAGAGSGKTRVLTHRIAYLIDKKGINPWNILAITFTNKAASEMRERVDKIVGFGSESIWVSTFHSTCVRILRRHIDRLGFDNRFAIYDTEDQKTLMKEICRKLNIDTKIYKERSLLAQISHAKDELITPDEMELNAGSDFNKKKVAAVYREYQASLRKNNALDFDDLIVKTVELFQNCGDVLENYQERFQYIMVDEYQDTNTAQFKFVSLLASKYENLCVVGDDDQSIYKFRGATIENILNFEKVFSGAKTIRLEQNYRSSGRILKAANILIANNPHVFEKRLFSELGYGAELKVLSANNEEHEAERVTGELIAHHFVNKTQYKDYAILYRGNHQSRVFEKFLMQNRIPYKISGGTSFFSRPEIKDLLAYLRVLTNPDDDSAFLRIVNTPKREIGPATLKKLGEWAMTRNKSMFTASFDMGLSQTLSGRGYEALTRFTHWLAEIQRLAEREPIAAVRDLIHGMDYESWLYETSPSPKAAEMRMKNVNQLFSWMTEMLEGSELDEPMTLTQVVTRFTLRDMMERGESEEELDQVQLMTLHASKGLEFPYVYMVGMEEGFLPHQSSIDEDNIDEERRLAYVGITRAQKELTFTLCKERRQYGELVRPEPSRFLLELPQDDLIWEQERKVVSAEERMQKGQSHLANLKAMMAAKRGK